MRYVLSFFSTEKFEANTPLHFATVAACFTAIAIAAWIGRSWRRSRPSAERALRLGWIAFLVPSQLIGQGLGLLPANFNVRWTLPLHMCDLVVWTVPFAMCTTHRLPRSVLYFWGVGMSTFAFWMPLLESGPARLGFWFFWIGHTQIVGSAVYVAAVLGYRPTLRDLRLVSLVTLAYIAAILPLDALLGVDYGFVGPDPSASSRLGPWPWRVPIVFLGEVLIFALLWLPWRLLASRQRALPREHRQE